MTFNFRRELAQIRSEVDALRPDTSCDSSTTTLNITSRVIWSKFADRLPLHDSLPVFYKGDRVAFSVNDKALNAPDVVEERIVSGFRARIIASNGQQVTVPSSTINSTYAFEYRFEYTGWKKIKFERTISSYALYTPPPPSPPDEDLDAEVDAPLPPGFAGPRPPGAVPLGRSSACVEIWVYVTEDIDLLLSIITELEGDERGIISSLVEKYKAKKALEGERDRVLWLRTSRLSVLSPDRRATTQRSKRRIKELESDIEQIERDIRHAIYGEDGILPYALEYTRVIRQEQGLVFPEGLQLDEIQPDALSADVSYAFTYWVKEVVTRAKYIDLVNKPDVDPVDWIVYKVQFDITPSNVRIRIVPRPNRAYFDKNYQGGSKYAVYEAEVEASYYIRSKKPGRYVEYNFNPKDVIKVKFFRFREPIIFIAEDVEKVYSRERLTFWTDVALIVSDIIFMGEGFIIRNLATFLLKRTLKRTARMLAKRALSRGGARHLVLRKSITRSILRRSQTVMARRVMLRGGNLSVPDIIRMEIKLMLEGVKGSNLRRVPPNLLSIFTPIYENFLNHGVKIFADGLDAALKKMWQKYVDSQGRSQNMKFKEYLQSDQSNQRSFGEEILSAAIGGWRNSFSSSISSPLAGSISRNLSSSKRVRRFYSKALEEPISLTTSLGLAELTPNSVSDLPSQEIRTKVEEAAWKTLRDSTMAGISTRESKFASWLTDALIEKREGILLELRRH